MIISVADGLNGFEQTSSWLSDNDYLFMAYSISGNTLAPGKHAILNFGDAGITGIRLGDAAGRKVNAIAGKDGGTTGIDRMGKDVMTGKGIYNVKGQKVAGSAAMLDKLPKGVYIIDGVKVVK